MTAGRRVVRIWLVDGVVIAGADHSEMRGPLVAAAEQAVDAMGPVPAAAAVDVIVTDTDLRAAVVESEPPDGATSQTRSSVLDTTTLVLLAARLRSRGNIDNLRGTVALLGSERPDDVDQLVPELLDRELLCSRGPVRRLSLTRTGRESLAAAMATATDAAGRSEVESAYESFLIVNQEFLATVSSWQSRHSERAIDSSLDDFRLLVNRIGPATDLLAGLMPRFAGYQSRFTRALGRAADRPSWVESPALDSVHTVWFELHEHLLASLGRSRVQEHR